MSESSEPDRCPSCGREIPPEAPQGLCPSCVLEGVANDVNQEAEATRTAARLGLQPPALEEIAAAFPQFEVLELIGSGGMGAVFKVRQPRLDRLVALKVLPRSLAGDERFTERFTREARALAKLSHPNIVSVHDFGESGGYHFLLMEFVDGANLREAMRAGRFTPEQAFHVVPEICAALQYAHDEGVLHRDIKPENLLLDTKGRVKIVDFGIAKLVGLDDEKSPPPPALTGSLAPGTPQYMAPEQIEQPSRVDHRADIYSLGVVFYEMLTGELPIGRFAPPSEKSTVGGDVDDIVFRSLEKEPDRRQQSAGEVRTQVEGVADMPPPAVSASSGQSSHHASARTGNSRRAGRALLLLGASVVVMLLVWMATFFWSYHMESKERAREQMMRAGIDAMQAEAVSLERRARDLREAGESAAVIQQLEADAEATLKNMFALQEQESARRRRGGINPGMMGALITFAVGSLVCGIAGLFATASGWKALRALRLSGEQRGRVSALVAALFLPVALVGTAIVCVLVLPARGNWVGPAISLSVIGIIAANAWLIMRTLRWLNTPPTATERAAMERPASLADSFGEPSGHGQRRRVNWAAWLLAFLVGIPVLFIGSCVAYLALSHDSSSRDDREARQLEAEATQKAPTPAEAEKVGDDLSTQERQIVGSWHFDQGLDVGDLHFTADRKWRMETADGILKISGTWKIVDGILEQEVEKSSESEQIGRLIQSDILELISDERLELRDREGGDTLILKPIDAMSEIEKELLGTWRPPESDQEKTISLASDRSFVFTTSRVGVMTGTWRLSTSSTGESSLQLVVREAHAGIETPFTISSKIANRKGNRLEFLAPLYGNEKLLVREVSADLGLVEAKMVGRWEGFDEARRGRYIFHSDRTYRSETVGHWEQGTWEIKNDDLVMTVTAAADPGRVGHESHSEIAEVRKGERLDLRAIDTRNVLKLRPIEPLSESEQGIVGHWRRDDPDKEESFDFRADRRFVVTTPKGRDEGFWRVFDGGARIEMVIVSTDKKIHRGVALHGKILTLGDERFEFENTAGGGTKALVRVPSAMTTAAEAPVPRVPDAAMKHSASDELSADELRLVGTWQLQVTADGQPLAALPDGAGRFEFRADRSWQMDEEPSAVSGETWRISEDRLQLIRERDDIAQEDRSVTYVVEAIEPMKLTLLFPDGGPPLVFARVLEDDD